MLGTKAGKETIPDWGLCSQGNLMYNGPVRDCVLIGLNQALWLGHRCSSLAGQQITLSVYKWSSSGEHVYIRPKGAGTLSVCDPF